MTCIVFMLLRLAEGSTVAVARFTEHPPVIAKPNKIAKSVTILFMVFLDPGSRKVCHSGTRKVYHPEVG